MIGKDYLYIRPFASVEIGLSTVSIKDIYYEITHYLNYHSIWLIIVAFVLFTAGWGLLEYRLYRSRKLYTTVNAVLFAASVFFVMSCTLLFRDSDARQGVSPIPFDIIMRALEDQVVFKSMVMNIALFLPLSLFGCSLFRCCSKKAAVIFLVSGTVFSIFIETLQYMLRLGQADVDDVLCNVAGLLIGYLLYRLHDRYIIGTRKPHAHTRK